MLGVYEACDNTDLKLHGRDDKSGKQRWLIEKVDGTEDQFTMRAGGRKNCKVSYLSWNGEGLALTTKNSGTVYKFTITESDFGSIVLAPSCSHINVLGGDETSRLTLNQETCTQSIQ